MMALHSIEPAYPVTTTKLLSPDGAAAESTWQRDTGKLKQNLYWDRPHPKVVSEEIAETLAQCINHVSQIATGCVRKGESWEDLEWRREILFKKSTASAAMAGSKTDNDDAGAAQENWTTMKTPTAIKACELFEGQGELFADNSVVVDVEPGTLWNSRRFFNALSLLDPQILRQVMIAYDSFANVYGLRFFMNGRFQYVLVDGYIQCTSEGKPTASMSRRPRELWPSIIEKGFIKVCGGIAAAESAGFMDVLVALTGGYIFSENLSATTNPDTLFQAVSALLDKGVIVTFSRALKGYTSMTAIEKVSGGNKSVEDRKVYTVRSVDVNHQARSEISYIDLHTQAQKTHFCHITPTNWSVSVIPGIFTPTSTLLYVVTVQEDMNASFAMSAWVVPQHMELLHLEQYGSIGFKVASMSRLAWEQFNGDRKKLLDILAKSSTVHSNKSGWCRQASAVKVLLSQNVYFIIPFFKVEVNASMNNAYAQPFSLRVSANKFCLQVETIDDDDSSVEAGINTFGFYMPDDLRSQFSEGPQHAEIDDKALGLQQTTVGMQGIKIVVLSHAVAVLMKENPGATLKYTKISKLERDTSIGMTLFSPKSGGGVRIKKMREGSPATRGTGLEVSDILLELNGVATFQDFHGERRWLVHSAVVDLVVRAGNSFTVIACRKEVYDKLNPPSAVYADAQLAAIEEGGILRPLPCAVSASRPTSGFVPSQIASSAKYRETAQLLHHKFRSGKMTAMEYQACLKAAVANALIAAREQEESSGIFEDANGVSMI